MVVSRDTNLGGVVIADPQWMSRILEYIKMSRILEYIKMSRILEYIGTGCLAALQAVAGRLVDDPQDGCVGLKQLVLRKGCCLQTSTC
jgi:hypothetical protein